MKALILDIIMAAGIAASVILGCFSEFSQQCEKLQYNVLRLHIPANSDSNTDQSIKLQLRDMLLKDFGSEFSECDSLDEAYIKAQQLLPEIDSAADEWLIEKGVDYTATAELVTMYFPTRKYDNVTLPAGNYNSLRVTLGSGEGHNWWCVMYPSLCLSAVGEDIAQEKLNEYSTELYPFISDEPVNIEIRFALFEMLKSLFC